VYTTVEDHIKELIPDTPEYHDAVKNVEDQISECKRKKKEVINNCPIEEDCTTTSTFRSMAIRHFMTHIDTNKYQCRECGYESVKKQDIEKHVKKVHFGNLFNFKNYMKMA
jgi:hypothetical protein